MFLMYLCAKSLGIDQESLVKVADKCLAENRGVLAIFYYHISDITASKWLQRMLTKTKNISKTQHLSKGFKYLLIIAECFKMKQIDISNIDPFSNVDLATIFMLFLINNSNSSVNAGKTLKIWQKTIVSKIVDCYNEESKDKWIETLCHCCLIWKAQKRSNLT